MVEQVTEKPTKTVQYIRDFPLIGSIPAMPMFHLARVRVSVWGIIFR
jgi:hypothetical protein